MSNFLKKILSKAETVEISVGQWVAALISVVFIRFFIEAVSNPGISSARTIASDPIPFTHYILFFAAVIFGSLVILELISGAGQKAANLMLFFMPVMWLAPILDLLFSAGKGAELRYIGSVGVDYLSDFLTFFGDSFSRGASLGIRIEIFIIMSGMSFLAWFFSKSRVKAVFAFFGTYIFVFLMTSIPGLISTIHSFFSTSPASYMAKSLLHSNIINSLSNSAVLPASYSFLMENAFDRMMAQIFFVLLCLFMLVWFWRVKRPVVVSVLKNSRPERASHYLMLVLVGMFYVFQMRLGFFTGWIDFVGVFCLLLAWYSFWVFSICLNDIEDLDADIISNPNRPLVSGGLTERQMKQSGLIFFLLAIFGSASVGYAPFYMMVISCGASYIYSAKPLRLKNIPIVATFLMAIASLASFLSGFFFLSQNKYFNAFPPIFMIGIVLFYTMFFNAKDLKDVEGDSAVGSKTIPVIFGRKKGTKIVAGLFSAAFIIAPFFFGSPVLYFIFLPTAVMGYFLITHQKFDEKPVFALYYVCLAAWLAFSLFK